jgi:hypothetical protein
MATTKKTAAHFAVPAELLKTFKKEIRFFPPLPHPAGYIMFDRQMLITVLERGTDAQRQEMVDALKGLGNAGGELVIMQG